MNIKLEGLLCKEANGKTLIEKDIYLIDIVGVEGKALAPNVKYIGKNKLSLAKNLVVFTNVFENSAYALEYSEAFRELSVNEKRENLQKLYLQPLTNEEIEMISSYDFIYEKELQIKEKNLLKI